MKAADIYPIVQWYTERFVDRDYRGVDDSLQDLDLTRPSIELVCVVRTTYPARNKLECWGLAVERVAEELERRSEDSNKLLKGLR